MEVICQLDNNNFNQCLIHIKDQNDYFWTFVVHFAIECELTPQKEYLLIGM